MYKATAAQQAAESSPEAGGAQQANAETQGQGQQGGGQTATDTKKEDIIDADFKAEDDNK